MKPVREFCFSIQNADAEKRLVSGVSESGEPNGAGLRLDYATSKPLLVAWSEGISKKTKGASKGILRVMHKLETVGKIVELGFDDEKRYIFVTVHVSDDKTWKKIQDGEYTGFSWWWRTQGAPWKNEDATKAYGRPIFDYTGKPIDLSIVDAAGVPGSDFTDIQNADFPEDDEMNEKETTAPAETGTDIKNGMYTAGRFGEALESIHWLIKAVESEEKKEGEDATIPDELKDGLRALAGPIAKYMVAQVNELAGGDDVDMFYVSDDDEFEDLGDVQNAEIQNGDFPGHPFRGNQHAGGHKAGAQHGASLSAHRATVRAHAAGDKASHKAAAGYHKAAAKANAAAGNKRLAAHHKEMAAYHMGVAGRVKNADGADVQNSDKADLLSKFESRLAALEAAKDVKNSDHAKGDDILATLAAAAAPAAADVKNADAASAGRVITKEEDSSNGGSLDVKNADIARRAEAERLSSLPESERAIAIAAKIFQGAAAR